uniref:Alpha-ketoglutarate-dependent dioxygenase AlkB-like domain-containing protein n=1 Tax=Octactis speculum TaxID=3111310 RepID=A0A7S2DG40_9STRA|mmetsp:Transcript_486/g.650  ORF Transcript_486/g.650 Transcript_486/m.650 type:complete len:303 (+) Transcript_486:73-981(+)
MSQEPDDNQLVAVHSPAVELTPNDSGDGVGACSSMAYGAQPISPALHGAQNQGQASSVPIVESKSTKSDHGDCADEFNGLVNLIPEFGVIHLRSALSVQEQRKLWKKCKTNVRDPPTSGGSGMTSFHVSSGSTDAKTTKGGHRDEGWSKYGELLFLRSAVELARQVEENESMELEPSYCRLARILSGDQPVRIDHISGNMYRSNCKLNNHCDMNKPFFTMSVALGNDAEFTVGRKTTRPNKNERSGRPQTLTMRSGDAMFFDGGSIPHSVDRILPDTAPAWWSREKTQNGSRVVVLFRESPT